MSKVCRTKRSPTRITVKLDEDQYSSDLQKYRTIAITVSARCILNTRYKRRTGIETETDGRTDKGEYDITAEGPADMLGSGLGDSEDEMMAL